jgi:hypothetical protein
MLKASYCCEHCLRLLESPYATVGMSTQRFTKCSKLYNAVKQVTQRVVGREFNVLGIRTVGHPLSLLQLHLVEVHHLHLLEVFHL